MSAVVVALLVARRPGALFAPQLWAEDGVVFLRDAWPCGPEVFFYQYAGYLHVFPRMVAVVAGVVDRTLAPAVIAYGALLAPITVVWVLTSPRLRVRTWQRAIMALPLALPPLSEELHLALANSHWYFPQLFALLAVLRPWDSRGAATEDALVAALAASSSPASVYFLPVVLLIRCASVPSGRIRQLVPFVPAVVLAGAQAYTVFRSGRPMGTASLVDTLPALLTGAVQALGGGRLLQVWPHRLLALLLVAAAVLWVAVWIVRARAWRSAGVFLGMALLFWGIVWATAPNASWVIASRYHYVPVTLLEWAFVVASPGALGPLIAVLAVSVFGASSLRLPDRPDVGWAAGVRCLDSGRTDCVLPIHPPGWVIDLSEPVGKKKLRCGDRD